MSSAYSIFSGDVEASGPLPNFFSMLSIGLVVGSGKRRERFYRELKPLHACHNSESMEYVKLSEEVTARAAELGGGPAAVMQALTELGTDPAVAMRECALWIRKHACGRKPLFTGSAASWDWQFIQYYFHRFLGFNPFGFAALDIKAYYMGMTGCAWEETSKQRLPDAFRSPLPHTHKSDEDAAEQHEIFLALRRFNAKRSAAMNKIVSTFDRLCEAGYTAKLGPKGYLLKRSIDRLRNMLDISRQRTAPVSRKRKK